MTMGPAPLKQWILAPGNTTVSGPIVTSPDSSAPSQTTAPSAICKEEDGDDLLEAMVADLTLESFARAEEAPTTKKRR